VTIKEGRSLRITISVIRLAGASRLRIACALNLHVCTDATFADTLCSPISPQPQSLHSPNCKHNLTYPTPRLTGKWLSVPLFEGLKNRDACVNGSRAERPPMPSTALILQSNADSGFHLKDRCHPSPRPRLRTPILVQSCRHLRPAHHLRNRHHHITSSHHRCWRRKKLRWLHGCSVRPRLRCQPRRNRRHGHHWRHVLRARTGSETRTVGSGNRCRSAGRTDHRGLHGSRQRGMDPVAHCADVRSAARSGALLHVGNAVPQELHAAADADSRRRRRDRRKGDCQRESGCKHRGPQAHIQALFPQFQACPRYAASEALGLVHTLHPNV